jgi:hypothetical protein
MRRIFTIVAAIFLLATTALRAEELNIYASGLSAGTVDDTKQEVKISYTLNAPATSLALILQAGEAEPVEIAITDAAALTKGAHTDVTVSLSGVPSGTYAWSIKATGEATNAVPVKLSDDSAPFQFYFPSGIAVDNSFESPYFGHAYVAEGDGGQCGGGGRLTEDGIYVYKPTLEGISLQPFAGNVNWSSDESFAEGVRSPGRLSIDAAGKVYIADNSTTNSGVYIMDPAHPETDFTSVFAIDSRDAAGLVTASSNVIHGRIPALYVENAGDNTVLYTIDRNCLPADSPEHSYIPSGMIFKYTIGSLAAPYSSLPEIIYNNPITGVDQNAGKLANDAMSLISDRRGGLWVCQNRGADAVHMPCILHLNSQGVEDYNSATASLGLGNTNASTRGGMAINPEGTLLAIGNNRYVRIYSITFDDLTGIPSLTQISVNAININGTNIESIAFDVADNIYVISASTERFYAYALPKPDNTFTTPAPSAFTLTVVGSPTTVDSNLTAKTPKSILYTTVTGITASDAAKGLLLKKTTYTDGSVKMEKVIK